MGRFMPWVALVGATVCAGVFAGASALAQGPPPSERVYVIAAGPPQGQYEHFARAVAAAVEAAELGFRLTVDSGSTGSVTNLQMLGDGRAQLAVAQSDTAFYAATRSAAAAEGTAIRTLLSLYDETFHVVLRRPLVLDGLAQLERRRLASGEVGSGTRMTAEIVLESLGMPREHLAEPPRTSRRRLVSEFVDNRVDAAFYVGRSPATLVCELVRRGGWEERPADLPECADTPCSGPAELCDDPNLRPGSLLSLTPAEVRQITRESPGLIPAVVHAGTYPGQTQEVHTVAVRALLLGHADALKPDDARALADLLAGPRADDWRREHLSSEHAERLAWIQTYRVTEGVRVPFHDGASEFLAEDWRAFPSVRVWREWLDLFALRHQVGMVLIGIALLWLGVFSAQRHRRYDEALHRHPHAVRLSLILLFFVCAAVLTWISERSISSWFSTFDQALWSIGVWLISGFEDRAPLTTWGQFGSIAVMSSWAVLLLFAVNVLFTKRIREALEVDVLPRRLSNHFVICHWNERAESVIRQLRAEERLGKRRAHTIVVLHPEPVDVRHLRQKVDAMRHVLFLQGDPGDREIMEMAKAASARSVIVLADDALGSAADGRTLLVLSALMEACQGTDQSHFVVEILLPENACRLLRVMGHPTDGRPADEVPDDEVRTTFRIPGVEILVTGAIESRVFSQVARTQGLVKLFFDLTTFSAGSQEIYAVPLPAAFAEATTFVEICEALIDARAADPEDDRYRCLPVGIRRDGCHIVTNPPPGSDRLEPGDELVVMARKEPDLSRLHPGASEGPR